MSTYSLTLVLRIWAFLFAWSGLLVFFFFGLTPLLFVVAVVCLALALPIYLLVEAGGNMLGRLLSVGASPPILHDERLAPELDKVRHCYRNGRYGRARAIIRDILAAYPGHGETLIWKAKVAVAADGDVASALSILSRVARNDGEKEEIRTWAAALCDELKRERRRHVPPP